MGWKRKHSLGIPESGIPGVPFRYQIIGDIAVISLPRTRGEIDPSVARTILSRHRNVSTILCRKSIPRGDSRVPLFIHIHGEKTETTCREFGFSYHLDLSRVFYTPRLASERARIAGLIRPGERVLVPFAGVGPFVVPIAARGARVTAIENSSASLSFLRENCEKNGVSSSVRIVEGDFYAVAPSLPGDFDRAVIPAPYGRDDALLEAAPLVRPDGLLHFYTFKKQGDLAGLSTHYSGFGLSLLAVRRCGNVAQGVSRYVMDLARLPQEP